jgi:glutathione S-transferase
MQATNALQVMEARLSRTAVLIVERYSIADVALHAYTHVPRHGLRRCPAGPHPDHGRR